MKHGPLNAKYISQVGYIFIKEAGLSVLQITLLSKKAKLTTLNMLCVKRNYVQLTRALYCEIILFSNRSKYVRY